MYQRDEKNIVNKLSDKYREFTKIKAMKEIWNDLFQSSILKFDDYWGYDDNDNLLNFIKGDVETLFKNGYSKTEKILMALIMIHFWGSISRIEYINADIFNLSSMYGKRRTTYLYLQSILDRYPDLFTQDM